MSRCDAQKACPRCRGLDGFRVEDAGTGVPAYLRDQFTPTHKVRVCLRGEFVLSLYSHVEAPRKIAPTIFPLVKLYAFEMGSYANYFQLSGCLFSLD